MFVAFLFSRIACYQEAIAGHSSDPVKSAWPACFCNRPNTGRTAWLNQQYLKMSHEVLAEMVGTTHARIGFFMNYFRKIGFIHYKGGLEVHSSLLNAFLHE
jgi:CRP/FNR family transcriptional regulator, cyclic AMP receptor protein